MRVRRHVACAMTRVALVVGMVGGTLIATTLPAFAVPGTITQIAPTSGTTTSAASGSFFAQLQTTGSHGPVEFDQLTGMGSLRVSSPGRVTTPGPLGVGTYTATGTDSDQPGPGGPGPGNQGDTGTWSFTLTVTPRVTSHTIVQIAPITGTTTTDNSKTFTSQMQTTGGHGPVEFDQSTGMGSLRVSSPGRVTTPGPLGVGTYTATGTDSDQPGPGGPGPGNQGDTGTWSFTLTVTSSGTSVLQAAPTNGSTTTADSTTFASQLNTTGNIGAVTFVTTASNSHLEVSSSGAVSVVSDPLAAGSYTVSGTDHDGSGDTGTWTFTLTVTLASQTITFSALSADTYGTAPLALTTTVSSGLLVAYIDNSANTICTVSGSTVTINGVGTCSITASQAGNAVYGAAPDVTQAFTINPASLIITASSTSVTYGAAIPTITPIYSGFVNGDNSASLSTRATCSSNTTRGSSEGTYASSCSGAMDSNYTITYVDGTVTVNAPFVPEEGPSVSALPSGVPSTDLGAAVSSSASSTVPITDTVTSGASSSVVMVPAGALPTGTTVSTYPITNTTSLETQVPAGNSYVAAIAISWRAPNGTSPAATAPITLTITDPNIKASDVIYKVTLAGLTNVGTAVVDGSVTITFTTDPVFMVTAKILVAQAALSVTSTSGTVDAALTLTSAGGSGTGTVSYTVVDGTASGCTISGGSLSVTSAGTCVVVATKAADDTYTSVSSIGTVVTLDKAASGKPSIATPAPAVVTFFYQSSLNNASKNALTNLSRKLVRGASVTITGYALKNIPLAKLRAKAVAAFLLRLKHIHVTIQIVTNRSIRKAKVVTTKI